MTRYMPGFEGELDNFGYPIKPDKFVIGGGDDTGTSGTKDNYFDLDRFSGLLEKLEGSKKRQQRQKSVEGRRDIFAGGLANMMSNF